MISNWGVTKINNNVPPGKISWSRETWKLKRKMLLPGYVSCSKK